MLNLTSLYPNEPASLVYGPACPFCGAKAPKILISDFCNVNERP